MYKQVMRTMRLKGALLVQQNHQYRSYFRPSQNVSPPKQRAYWGGTHHRELTVKNLVLKGGGVEGAAYVGALLELEEQLGTLNSIERVVGTSSGAIFATLLAVGYTPEEIVTVLGANDFSFEQFVREGPSWDDCKDSSISSVLLSRRGIPPQVIQDLWQYPLYACKGYLFLDWMDTLIAKKLTQHELDLDSIDDVNTINDEFRHLTFGQLRIRLHQQKTHKYKQLYLVYNEFKPSTKELVCPVYSTETSMDNQIIAYAVLTSISIPGLLKPYEPYFWIGGKPTPVPTQQGYILNHRITNASNYPINLFDQQKYLDVPNYNQSSEEPNVNDQTLGLELCKKDWIKSQERSKHKLINDLRSIRIYTGGMSMMDCRPPEYNELITSARTSVKVYFQQKGQILAQRQQSQRQNRKVVDDHTLESVVKWYQEEERQRLTSHTLKDSNICNDDYHSVEDTGEIDSEVSEDTIHQIGAKGVK